MRSDAATIRQTERMLTRHRSVVRDVSSGRRLVAKVSAIERRKQNPDNYRDLSEAVRHLTYHMCPFSNSAEAWKWNLDQLRKRWTLFNGTRVLGINYDEDTVTPEDLLTYCSSIGLHWDYTVIRPNSRSLGEVMTWVPSLEHLCPDTAEENEVVFSAHAKGVKYGEVMPPLVSDWSSIMYAVNLDRWNRVRESLEWFVATGAFKMRHSRRTHNKLGWHYSGAFWWWRLADVGRCDWRQVAQHYAGREFWMGDHIFPSESDTLFLDNSMCPYRQKSWTKMITPKWEQYKRSLSNENI